MCFTIMVDKIKKTILETLQTQEAMNTSDPDPLMDSQA